ncbi:hypothetical protein ABZX51_011030 [Aspergillus tubingensis]
MDGEALETASVQLLLWSALTQYDPALIKIGGVGLGSADKMKRAKNNSNTAHLAAITQSGVTLRNPTASISRFWGWFNLPVRTFLAEYVCS